MLRVLTLPLALFLSTTVALGIAQAGDPSDEISSEELWLEDGFYVKDFLPDSSGVGFNLGEYGSTFRRNASWLDRCSVFMGESKDGGPRRYIGVMFDHEWPAPLPHQAGFVHLFDGETYFDHESAWLLCFQWSL